jgi:hypothetical protein
MNALRDHFGLAGLIPRERRHMFWRPPRTTAGEPRHWFSDTSLNEVGMSELAARTIYRILNLFPQVGSAANDRDDKRW